MSTLGVSCYPGGGPSMNTDVSGIGVRISFYLQTIFLGLLSARSSSLDEITGALYTLIATNLAMVVTALILGLKPNPEISFQDALVVFYLLAMAWTTNIFSLPSCIHFKEGVKTVQFFSVLQSGMLLAFASVLLVQAKTFGSNPECNANAVLVIFAPFRTIEAGRIIGGIITVVIVVGYTYMTVKDCFSRLHEYYLKNKPTICQDIAHGSPTPSDPSAMADPTPDSSDKIKETPILDPRRLEEGSKMIPGNRYSCGLDGALVVKLFLILVACALAILNTELLIIRNHFKQDDAGSRSQWQFGQVLPIFLVVLPFINVVTAYREQGIRKPKRYKV